MWWWIGHILGLDDPSGPWYLAWSGFVGDLSYLSVLGAGIVVIRKHQCHVKRCWRAGRHSAGQFVVCRKHHPTLPDGAPTHAEVAEHVAGLRP